MSAVHWKVVVSPRGADLPFPAAFDVGPCVVLAAIGFAGDRRPAAEPERVRPRVAFGPPAHAGSERSSGIHFVLLVSITVSRLEAE